jgi:hypothetical protein
VRSLSDPLTADHANYGASTATALLDDCLGGNCLTHCVLTVAPAVTPGARAALRLAAALRCVRNHPVVNEERACGLARVRRVRALHTSEELAQADIGAERRVEWATASLQQRVGALLQQLEMAEDERARAVAERAKLYDMYADFRQRFADMVESRAHVQADLLRSEQERLALSQRLLEARIDAAEARETAAAATSARDIR